MNDLSSETQGRLFLVGLACSFFQGAVFCTLKKKQVENESPSCVCTFVYIGIHCKTNMISSIEVLITIFRPECFFTFILGRKTSCLRKLGRHLAGASDLSAG